MPHFNLISNVILLNLSKKNKVTLGNFMLKLDFFDRLFNRPPTLVWNGLPVQKLNTLTSKTGGKEDLLKAKVYVIDTDVTFLVGRLTIMSWG